MKKIIPMTARKRVALVAHDHVKDDLLDWARQHRDILSKHKLYGTGTTGTLLKERVGLDVDCLQTGPLGGDQQVGARIVDGEIDFLIFFWDPLEAQPHDPDVKALLRVAVIWNIPLACNRTSADFMISSELMTTDYERSVLDYEEYKKNRLAKQ